GIGVLYTFAHASGHLPDLSLPAPAGHAPLRVLHRFGAALGTLVLWRGGRTAHHTAVNLRIARPSLPYVDRAPLLREVMAEGGKSISEIVKVWGSDAG